jgi:glucose/arabinose dehydrogenase
MRTANMTVLPTGTSQTERKAMNSPSVPLTVAIIALLAGASCDAELPPTTAPGAPPGTAGLKLPEGFAATVFADNLGRGRHIIVRKNGDVYVSLRERSDQGGGIVALRDTDRDGVADETRYFGDVAGTGLDLRDDHLYFGENTRVVRFKFAALTDLVPSGDLEIVVDGFPDQRAHEAKPITFDGQGKLYVNIGVPSNACQAQIRTPGSPGRQPCPELPGRGIYVYDADKLGQQHPADGTHFATGLRQTVALEWNAPAGALYLVMHGRDQLSTLFPDLYTDRDNAELPAEELHRVAPGLDAGWPYTYWDPRREARMVAPEYGGNGKQVDESGQYAAPLVAFPAHWAPNDMVFYNAARWGGAFTGGRPFPERYHNGAFIAFHGSWNRAPLPQQGYCVVFQPFEGQQSRGEYEKFADRFAGEGSVRSPNQAEYRPCGVAVAPDGALFVVDSVRGRVWRITYAGD